MENFAAFEFVRVVGGIGGNRLIDEFLALRRQVSSSLCCREATGFRRRLSGFQIPVRLVSKYRLLDALTVTTRAAARYRWWRWRFANWFQTA